MQHDGMLELVFHAEAGSAAVSVFETVGILVADGQLSVGGGPVLAAHADGVWRIGETTVSRITCRGPIELELQNGHERQTYGPFTDLVIGQNTIWTASGAVARYNDFTKKWSLALDGSTHPVERAAIKLAQAA